MPWQKMVADVGLEILENGLPAYREVVVTVPRQNGKTFLVLAWELHRALLWSDRIAQLISYGAADGNAARKKLLFDQWPIVKRSPLVNTLLPGSSGVRQAAGQEAFIFLNGSRIEVLGSSESAGHGRTVNLAVADEVWSDLDNRREQALVPAMATVRDAQLLVVSTAGHEASVYLRRKVEAGRAAVEANQTTGIAYFEWSADEDADIEDPDTWHSCMPALGYTIDESVVSHALASLDEQEFRRAFLNQWTESHERVIPAQAWNNVLADVSPYGSLTYGVDVNPERSFASIAVMDRNGNGELGEYRAGTAWVGTRLIELCAKRNASVAIDAGGPAASLIPELENAGVVIIKLGARDIGSACGAFYDAIADGLVNIRNAAPLIEHLNNAVAVASKRPLGDAWAFARRNTTSDISPLVALTLAYWASAVTPQREYRILSLTD